MESTIEATAKKQAAGAVGRTFGALFFSTFGALWLGLALYAFGHLTRWMVMALAAGWAVMTVSAILLQRRGRDAARNAHPRDVERRNGRAFATVNVGQWLAIFATFQLCNRFHRPELACPTVVLIVGLHFFAMPPLYRHRDNTLTGWLLTLWAIVCLLAFHGDRLIAMSALGAGVVLWLSASRGLLVARRQLVCALG